MDNLSVVFSNIAGFDGVIFLVAVANFFIFAKVYKSADELYKRMHKTVFVPDHNNSKAQAESAINALSETEVVSMRNKTGKIYSVFVNLTGVFPLLGILGTVASLLSVMDDMSNVTGNFYAALTSTFWGLVFAIIYKVLDGMVSAKIEDNEKTVQLYLERNSIAQSSDKDVAI